MPLHPLPELALLARLTREFPRFLRTPIDRHQAAWTVQQRLSTREGRFLPIAERAGYRHPQSPYLRLLRTAGSEFGDLKALIAKEGLEGALSYLREAGVYVTFDELKGRKEAVRGSRRGYWKRGRMESSDCF